MAINKVKGIISHKGEVQSGTSQSGFDWSRQTIVLDVASFNGTFSKIALTAQNQKVTELLRYQIGDRVEVGYSVTAREWNGKWINSVDLVNISLLDDEVEQAPTPTPAPRQVAPTAPLAQPRRVARPAMTTPLVPPGENNASEVGDLPF